MLSASLGGILKDRKAGRCMWLRAVFLVTVWYTDIYISLIHIYMGFLSLGMAGFPFIYFPSYSENKGAVCCDEKRLELPKLQGTGHPERCHAGQLFFWFPEVALLKSWESQSRTTICVEDGDAVDPPEGNSKAVARLLSVQHWCWLAAPRTSARLFLQLTVIWTTPTPVAQKPYHG